MDSLLTRSLKPQGNRIAPDTTAPMIGVTSPPPSGGEREFSGYFYWVSIDAWRSTQLIEERSYEHKPNSAFVEPLMHCLHSGDSPNQRPRAWGDTVATLLPQGVRVCSMVQMDGSPARSSRFAATRPRTWN